MFSSKIFTRISFHKINIRTFRQQQRPNPSKERSSPNNLLWKIIEENNIKGAQDWKDVRTQIQNEIRSVTPASIDAMTVSICTRKKKFNLALSYLDFLNNENVKLNLATLGKYFKLLYVKGVEESLATEDEEKILQM